ncbi:MAG TPA: LLM class F420-dependent oxidoreductase [Miltoncostaea sp.]|nr:LLM class F420-dependent oxidoreductase [Miltoncostaea sp.]
MPTVRLGYFLPQMGPAAGPDAILSVARRAEELGYDSLWVTERTLFPLEPSVPYVASADGSLPDVYRDVIDPLTVLAFVASATERVTIGPSVLNLPWYNPTLLARSLTALDVLSKGRLKVGFGMGWSPDEYEAAGANWHRRGKRADENLEALLAIWTTDPVEYEGSEFNIPKSVIGPKPVQQPHPPIYMAAYTEAAMDRVARFADGWMPVGVPLDGMTAMLAGIRQMAAGHGRDGDAIELIVRANVWVTDEPLGDDRFIFTGTPDQIRADVEASREAGAAELDFDITFDPNARTADDFLRGLETWMEVATK